jgi:hypothetical protein
MYYIFALILSHSWMGMDRIFRHRRRDVGSAWARHLDGSRRSDNVCLGTRVFCIRNFSAVTSEIDVFFGQIQLMYEKNTKPCEH